MNRKKIIIILIVAAGLALVYFFIIKPQQTATAATPTIPIGNTGGGFGSTGSLPLQLSQKT